MECYACANQATRQCRRCARVYCELHGGDLCAECLSPASSLPSFNLYRGSLLALLVGTAVALWLIVRPPGSGDSEEVFIPNFTPTAIVTEAPETPETTAIVPATAGRTATATPRTTSTPGPTSTEEPPAVRTYIVQEGDSLSSIAEQFAPPGVDANQYVFDIADANGISADALLSVGVELILP